jgi:hypothetical protein
MEGRHIIELVPAGEFTRIIPQGIAAPAMVNSKFIEIVAPVADAPFFEYLFDQVYHVSGIICPVTAAVDEENIKPFPVIPEFLFF